jgi:hypothetical protein
MIAQSTLQREAALPLSILVLASHLPGMLTGGNLVAQPKSWVRGARRPG